MAGILLATGLYLLMQGCLCSVGQTNTGCRSWTPNGDNVCCDACHPGHRLVTACGPKPKDLCTLCDPGTFTKNPKDYKCNRCTQCVGALMSVKQCTATTDTVCGCKEGLLCGNAGCSFCIKRCDKGQEPAEKRSCRSCPPGTFNNQIHQKCKPWSTKCPHPDETIVAQGDELNDIKCANVTMGKVQKPTQPGQAWHWVFPAVTSVLLVVVFIIIIGIVVRKTLQERKEYEVEEVEKPSVKTPIITTPTDDPRTLIAIECSFHEAQQEQGSSSESLISKDSSGQLIG